MVEDTLRMRKRREVTGPVAVERTSVRVKMDMVLASNDTYSVGPAEYSTKVFVAVR